MESKHKNALIGALLAVVFVMAVGYAAFAQQLTINGTAEITSTWDVHFTGTQAITIYNGFTDSAVNAQSQGNPWGTMAFDSDKYIATLTADLVNSEDYVEYEITPHNYGTISAHASTVTVKIAGGYPITTTVDASAAAANLGQADTLTLSSSNTSVSKKVGNITYTATFNPKATVASGQDDNTITIKVEYTDTANAVNPQEAAAISVVANYVQV